MGGGFQPMIASAPIPSARRIMSSIASLIELGIWFGWLTTLCLRSTSSLVGIPITVVGEAESATHIADPSTYPNTFVTAYFGRVSVEVTITGVDSVKTGLG